MIENVAALCDVDSKRAAGAFKLFPNVKRYRDCRMPDREEKHIDAVVVTAPDHACSTALRAVGADLDQAYTQVNNPIPIPLAVQSRYTRPPATASKTPTTLPICSH